jgi:hypothetical protein
MVCLRNIRADTLHKGDIDDDIIIIIIIIIIIGATGTISKSLRKYMSNIPGNHKVKELQKTAILGTAHILRQVLTYELESRQELAIYAP